ncbi:hypothetical protein GCM10023116_39660 [Kistimonas scapharcae]|uniref:DUF2635 domain-containing protein n=1 Tax=Kistimonas scapharcae TaxID=1036133 RepID=A0ABP8V785_9GAMM
MTFTIKPADGLKVRKPDGSHLAADGESVVLTGYWRRRLADGDVVKATASKNAKKGGAA